MARKVKTIYLAAVSGTRYGAFANPVCVHQMRQCDTKIAIDMEYDDGVPTGSYEGILITTGDEVPALSVHANSCMVNIGGVYTPFHLYIANGPT